MLVTFGEIMSETRYPAIIFIIVILVSLSLPLFYYSRLPETVASHFNFNGTADAWMSKESFLLTELGITIFLSALFLSIAFFLPKFPVTIINLPNKEHWLSPERRGESLKIFQRYFLWFGSLTIGFLTIMMQEVYLANLSDKVKISGNAWIYLTVFLSAIAIMTVKLFMHFNKTDNKDEIPK